MILIFRYGAPSGVSATSHEEESPMNPITVVRLPFTRSVGWKELQQRRPSIPLLAWAIVLPMSLLPPVLLYYAGTHYGDAFVAGFADREWRFITTILFLAELL